MSTHKILVLVRLKEEEKNLSNYFNGTNYIIEAKR